ncbi:MAG: CUB domain-containing protein [Proteobacteria bacterium]|nr:CUB domain-containing protein [Pseudomonadota bacterium]
MKAPIDTGSWCSVSNNYPNHHRYSNTSFSKVRTRGTITLYAGESKKAKAVGTYALNRFPPSVLVPGSTVHVTYKPKGKVIHFEFIEFDTQPKTDLIYFFNGRGTNEKIMAIFSGPNIPPELTTWQNEVLVWFVSDGKVQGQGWKAKVSFREKKKKGVR